MKQISWGGVSWGFYLNKRIRYQPSFHKLTEVAAVRKAQNIVGRAIVFMWYPSWGNKELSHVALMHVGKFLD